jgi:hypothetical protein
MACGANGGASDMVNRTRAKDAAEVLALGLLNAAAPGARRMSYADVTLCAQIPQTAALVDRAPLDTRIESYGVVQVSLREAISQRRAATALFRAPPVS